MQTCDVLVVGGGPAGSTSAWKLRQAGLDVLVLDKAAFPRHKVCAGWITPLVLEELQIDLADYARGRVLQPLTAFRTGRAPTGTEAKLWSRWSGGPLLTTDYGKPVSYGIRRCEFDDYLLRRSGARLELGQRVETIRRTGDGWVINDRVRTPLLVAAGGHFCPVARFLEAAAGVSSVPRAIHGQSSGATRPPVAAQEIEFELSARQKTACPVQPGIPEIYFCDDLMGYGWCIRKGDFLNVGLGREDPRRLPRHVADFCAHLKQQGRIPPKLPGKFRGHAYLLYDHSSRPLLDDGVVVVGDAAGLAFSQSGEGIRPAVESALIAAAVILQAGGDYRRDRLEPYRQRLTHRLGNRSNPTSAERGAASRVRRWIGLKLLASRWFTRHVLLDRWFLHARQQPLTAWEPASPGDGAKPQAAQR
jgi:flavin-dependent dehydrogenase